MKRPVKLGCNRLSMLLAKPVDQLPAGTATCAELPKIAQLVPVGDGVALLKRRPDIRQAERRLAASTAGIGVATGELYPDISIGATIGTVGLIDDLGDPSTNRWGFGPSLSWKVPTNGAVRESARQEAATQGALAHFERRGAQRHSRNPDRSGSVQRLAATPRCAGRCRAVSETAADQTHRFFQAGRESFLADLQATRTYTDVTAQLAAANTQVAMSQIDLFLALGGGWESGRTHAPSPGKP